MSRITNVATNPFSRISNRNALMVASRLFRGGCIDVPPQNLIQHRTPFMQGKLESAGVLMSSPAKLFSNLRHVQLTHGTQGKLNHSVPTLKPPHADVVLRAQFVADF